MPDTELLEKLKKIKALADEAQDDHECQTAMMMFQRLLTKNGLDVAEVEAMPDTCAEKPEETDVYEGTRIEKWRHYLHMVIAQHFRCIPVTMTRYTGLRMEQHKQILQFIGHRRDVQIAAEAYATALAAGERLYSRHRLRVLEAEAFGDVVTLRSLGGTPNYSRYMLGFGLGMEAAYKRQEAEATFDIILTTPSDVLEHVKGFRKRTFNAKAAPQDGNTSAGYADGFNVGYGDRLTEQA
jgi:hypothetical protein